MRSGCEMEWFRVEGVFPECEQVEILATRHPKQFEKAITLWLYLGCYCARNTTDGRISEYQMNRMVPTMQRPSAAVKALIDSGLLEYDGDYVMPNYLKYNPSKEEREKWRADNARRQREYRERRCNALHNELVTEGRNSVSNTPPVLSCPDHPFDAIPPPAFGERPRPGSMEDTECPADWPGMGLADREEPAHPPPASGADHTAQPTPLRKVIR